ncbi:MAG: NAD(P)-dependent oxidoreductase [Betaproteobacteria bacterium]|nr:NAD(P)-dependent oxidoreductase [Betaproteobacteria bacterium]MDH3438092.1 NAD(P)-dependent oxidoreductase [Betaproteobacteria bacterium]
MNPPVIGVIGLGIMGGAMAEALLEKGYKVVGHDIVPAARRRLGKAGGRPLASGAAVARSADIVITSLATVEALEDVIGQLAMAGRPRRRARPVVIETSTLPLADKEQARRRLQAARISALDCPISGTAVRLKERAWTIFGSGPKAAFDRVRPVLQVFTDKVPYCGAFGNGSKMKFAVNHLVAILNVATAESLAFGRKMGLDPRQLLELFGPSPIVGTGVYRLRGAMMARRRYRPPTMKVEVWQKDMQVIGDMAKSVDCPTPLFTACAPLYSAAMAQGYAQADTASVHEVLAVMAGIARPKRGHVKR